MNTLRIAFPGLLAALALAGCSGGTTETKKTVAADLCVELGVVCNDPSGKVACDPADGLCKCGGHGGVVCGPGSVCDLDLNVAPPSATCVSELCAGVTCNTFESCDAADGVCKCGGERCAAGATCLADGCSDEDPCAGVVCGDNQVCDPADRACKCGGSTCSVGESCRLDDTGVGYCVGRNCVGKNCADGTVCNPVDGLCHCGTAEGDICTAGQACETTAGESVCVGQDICEGVVCPGNATCSPLDGKCRCGGFDATAPVCAADQTCDLSQDPPRCVGGDACATVTCAPGSNLSCDGETGECRCGGTGGLACAAEQGCVDSGGAPACVTRCDPNTTNVSVAVCGQVVGGALKGCYLSPADGLAYCADAGKQGEGADCQSPTECAADHHCVQSGADAKSGVCRRYCDVTVPGDCFQADRSCVPLAGRPAGLPNLGVCMVVTL